MASECHVREDEKMIPGDNDLTFRTATGELVKAGKRLHVEGCDDWEVRGVQASVC